MLTRLYLIILFIRPDYIYGKYHDLCRLQAYTNRVFFLLLMEEEFWSLRCNEVTVEKLKAHFKYNGYKSEWPCRSESDAQVHNYGHNSDRRGYASVSVS